MASSTPSSTTTSTPVISGRLYNVHCQCFLNAYINQQGIYKALDLKMVVGSVGWNDWFEYGGKGWTLLDFIKAKKGKGVGGWDAHCWLEDAEGKVYDFISETDDLYTRFRTGRGLKVKGAVMGVSKADLKAKGVEYVPADADTQYAIFKSQMPHIADHAQALLDERMACVYSSDGQTNFSVIWEGGADALEKHPNYSKFQKRGLSVRRPYIVI